MTETESQLRFQAAQALRWSFAGRTITQIIRWSSTLIVIRLLAPEDYGLMAMCMAVISFAVLFNELGANSIIIRNKELSKEDIGSIQSSVALINMALGCLLFVLAPYLSRLYDADITAILRVTCLAFPAYAIGLVQEALLIRAMDFKLRAIVETVAQLAGAMTALSLAFAGFAVWSLVTAFIVTRVTTAIGFLLLARERYPWCLRFAGLRPHTGYAFSILGQRTLSWLPTNFTILALGILHGPTSLGLYNVGYNLAFMPLAKFGSVLNLVGFATYARSQQLKDGVRRALETSLSYLAFPLFPYALLVAALAPEGIALLFGSDWSAVTPVFQAIALALPFRALNIQLTEAMNAAGYAGTALKLHFVSATLITGSIVAGGLWSIEMAAVGWIVATPAVHLINLLTARRVFGLSFDRVTRSYGPPILAGALAFGSIFALRQILPAAAAACALPLLAIPALSLALLTLYVFRKQQCLEIIQFVRA